MSKRWMRFAAGALVLGVATAGCGRESDGGEASAPVDAEAIADGPATGTVSMWAFGTEGESLGVLADDFMADNPDVTIEITPIPVDAAHDKLASAIAAGETPDMAQIGTTWMGEFAATGSLDPTPTDLIDEAEFFPGPWATGVVDGTSYGAPWYTETRVIYYRTDLAEAAGVTAPPATWDELSTMVAGMQEAGAEYGISLQPGGTGSWQTMLPFAWQNGAELATDEEFTIDTPEMVEAVEYYDSFFTDGLAPTSVEPGALESGFIDGSIGSFVSGPWHMSILDDRAGEEFRENWAVAHMPVEETGASFVGGSDLAVFKDTENRDAAWKFADYLTQPEVQQKWYETVSALPAVSAAWESGALADDEALSVFGAQLKDAQSPPTIPTWEEVASAIDAELEKVTVGDAEAAAAVESMQQKASSIGTGS